MGVGIKGRFIGVKLDGKRFLVIGGGGFIGSHLVEALLRENVQEIVVFDNFSRGQIDNLSACLDDNRVTIAKGGGDKMRTDVLTEACDGIDGIFDLAALWLLHCQDYPRSAFEVNVVGSFNVIEAAVKKGVKKIIHSSSASVYGNALAEPMNEDHPLNFENFYGATKAATEMIYRGMYSLNKDKSSSFDFVALRYMNVYGSRQDYLGTYIAILMKMLDKIELRQPIQLFGDGMQSYDFVHVKDCARANVLAMKSESTNVALNVGTGTKTSLNELASLVLKLTNSESSIEYLPQATSFVTNRVGGTELASKLIDFESEIDLTKGLEELIVWRQSLKIDDIQRISRKHV